VAGINNAENYFTNDYENIVDPFYYYSPNRELKEQA
jgi:hypothetical protein